jgi:hypothetical protein
VADLRRGSSTTATAESTTESGSELAGSTTLLAALLTTTVAAITVTTGTTTATRAALTFLTTEHAAGRSVGALLLDVSSRHDLGGDVEPFAEVVETLGGEGVVVVLPRETGLDVSAGGQGLASLDDLFIQRMSIASVVFSMIWRLLTKRFLVSISPCLGRLKSFLATSTPSKTQSDNYTSNRIVGANTYHGRGTRGSSCGRPWE